MGENGLIAMKNSPSQPHPSLPRAGLDLNLLTVFEALYQERHVSRAAERLGLAQPTVSHTLNRLRRITGDPLFVRTARGMEPTPHADAIEAPLRQAMAMLRSTLLAPRAFDPAHDARTFTLFLTDLGEAFFLPRLLAHLRAVAPAVKLVTLPMPERHPSAALERGEVDLAIGHLPDMGADFYQQRLFLERYVCLVGPRHPLLDAQGRLSKRRFLQASHAVVLPSGTGHNLVEHSLTELGLADRIALKVQNFLVLPAIVRSTDLVALVPRSVAASLAEQDTVHFVPAPIPLPEFVVKQCWHARYHHDAGNQWLRQQMAHLFTRSAR